MAVKPKKSITNGTRARQVLSFKGLSKEAPVKSLLSKIKKHAGRTNTGVLTVRHRGGGSKRRYRLIDFYRNKKNVAATVLAFEYDPNRTANIALIQYKDGDKAYIIATAAMKIGQEIVSGVSSEIRDGNTLELKDIPVGAIVHNVEIEIGGGAKFARAAGAGVTLVSKNEKYATLKLPSGEVRMVHVLCRATMGSVGNTDNRNVKLGKAGAKRWRGFRPTVRGAVMNACDHPHGGGEGKAPVGRSGPMTPWGKPALGYKTRKKESSFILKRRK